MTHLRSVWSRSKTFRVILIAALVYTLLRLAVQGVLIVTVASSGESGG